MDLTVNNAQMYFQNNQLSLLLFSVVLSNPSIKDSPDIEIQVFPSDGLTMKSTEQEVIDAALAKIQEAELAEYQNISMVESNKEHKHMADENGLDLTR